MLVGGTVHLHLLAVCSCTVTSQVKPRQHRKAVLITFSSKQQDQAQDS